MRLALPHFPDQERFEYLEVYGMTFYRTEVGNYSHLLQEAAARTGFSASEMQELLECELEIDHLLNYITAVVSDRMN